MSTGRPTALAFTEYLLLSKRTRQVFDTDAGSAWKPSNRPRYGTRFGRSSSKTSHTVKGFRMHARRRREGRHGGRRPKSLEGGNRGGVRTGGVSGYGDLAPVFDLIF